MGLDQHETLSLSALSLELLRLVSDHDFLKLREVRSLNDFVCDLVQDEQQIYIFLT